jgi:hypothetical protein
VTAPGPEKKIDTLRRFMAAEDWENALRLAARFQDLGGERVPITRGWEALKRPSFYRALGQDPDAHVRAAVEALRRRYTPEPPS